MPDKLQIRQKIDAICNQFEEAWSAARRPEFAHFFHQVEPDVRQPLLRALLEVDVELRTKAGQQILANDYQQLGDEAVAIVEALIKAIPSVVSSPDVFKTIAPETPTPILHTSKQIGPYKLLQQIGEGGMGTVWMAEQEKPVKRRVALKVIKAGVGSQEVITRFEAERQALSLMNHPNIARILDVGTTADGQPYFAMELVQGQPLTSYCDNNRVGISERLQLFAEVCSGVQHAHQKGIIHRDLKPSNILVAIVDGKPVPKVIDFGLAKALESTQRLTDQSLFTGIGQILGTLKYMSPEQASLDLVDIDTRTDIYSLGVILYELLTGSTPLDNETVRGEAMLNVLQIIRDKEPAKPSSRLSTDKATLSSITNSRRTDSSSLNRILVGDLDWVVVKALEKDRSRRYESASGLAADVLRFLNNEPVIARPPSAVYRIRKFVRKNRAGVTAAALLVVAMLAGLAGTTWQMRRAQIAESNAEQSKDLAQTNEQSARQQSQLALSTLTSVIDDIQGGLKNLSGGGEIRRRLLTTSLEKLESVAAKYVEQADVDRNTMVALSNMGDVILQFGADDGQVQAGEPSDIQQSSNLLAKSFYTRALEIAQKLEATDPANLATKYSKAAVYSKLGDTSLNAGEMDEARSIYMKALEISSRLAEADPNNAQSQKALSFSNEKMGKVTLQAGQLQEALGFYQQALRIDQTLTALNPGDEQAMRSLSISYNNLGDLSLLLAELPEAFVYYRQALEIREKLVAASPNDSLSLRDLSVSHNKLGKASLTAGYMDEAIDYYRKMNEIVESLVAADLNDVEAQRDLASSYENLDNVSLQAGQIEEAHGFRMKAFEIRNRLAAADPNNARDQRGLIGSCHRLGDVCMLSGEVQEALSFYSQALDVAEKLAAIDPLDTVAQRDLAVSFSNLGKASQESGLVGDALGFYKSMNQILENLSAADSTNQMAQRDLATSFNRLGKLCVMTNKFTEAHAYYRRMNDIVAKLTTADPTNAQAKRDLAVSYAHLGYTCKKLNQVQESLDYHSLALDIRKELAISNPTDMSAQSDLSESYEKTGEASLLADRMEDALEFFLLALPINEKLAKAQPDNSMVQYSLSGNFSNLGNACLKLSRFQEALTYYRQMNEVMTKLAAGEPSNLLTQQELSLSYSKLGMTSLRIGQLQDSFEFHQQELNICARLAAAKPNDTRAQRDLMVAHYHLGDVHKAKDEFEIAASEYESGAMVSRRMIELGMNVEPSRKELAILEKAAKSAILNGKAFADWEKFIQQPVNDLPALLGRRATEFAKRSRFAEAAQAAARIREIEGTDKGQLYNAACVFSLCAASIQSVDGQELTGEQSTQRQAWISDAIATLKKSIDAGWDDFDHMRQDSDLTILQDLPEFEAMVAGRQ